MSEEDGVFTIVTEEGKALVLRLLQRAPYTFATARSIAGKDHSLEMVTQALNELTAAGRVEMKASTSRGKSVMNFRMVVPRVGGVPVTKIRPTNVQLRILRNIAAGGINTHLYDEHHRSAAICGRNGWLVYNPPEKGSYFGHWALTDAGRAVLARQTYRR